VLGNMMTGLLNAKSNLDLASQNQRIAKSFIGEGRVRVRQGLSSGNAEAVEEGEELIAKGEAMKSDTFEHLNNALSDLNSNINAAVEKDEESKESEKSEAPSETAHENLLNITV
jgi:hypothetical protein